MHHFVWKGGETFFLFIFFFSISFLTSGTVDLKHVFGFLGLMLSLLWIFSGFLILLLRHSSSKSVEVPGMTVCLKLMKELVLVNGLLTWD